MQHLEGSGTPFLYMGRTVLKGSSRPRQFPSNSCPFPCSTSSNVLTVHILSYWLRFYKHSRKTFFSCVHMVAKAQISFVMSVRLSVHISAAPTGRIYVKFGTGAFMKNCRENANLVTAGYYYSPLCMKTYVSFIVAGEVKSPRMRSFQVEWYRVFLDRGRGINIRRTRHNVTFYVHCLFCMLFRQMGKWNILT
jgi:hypothetical protein